jgi:propionate CoA-transferase
MSAPATTKLMSAREAVDRIPIDAVMVVDGSGGGVNQPDAILNALAQRFSETASPSGITVIHPSGLGDGLGGGIDRLANPGLVKRVIGGHWGWTPRMQKLALAGEIEAYCLPQGVMSHWMREVAAGRPGVLTTVGIGTACDPRLEGGKLNARTTDDLVELVELRGREWLLYHSFPVDVAIIKGSYADERGNLCMDDEGLFAEVLSAAQAASNSGGIVIAQVNSVVQAGTIDPRRVKVPGFLIDAIVVEPSQRLSATTVCDRSLTGAARAVLSSVQPMPMSERKVIAARAAAQLRRGDVVNLGYGMPDGVGQLLLEAGLAHDVVLTVEQGHIGGLPLSGSDFGMSRNAEASLDAGYQFDFYDGGGLDTAVLSFAQVDQRGNINVGRFGDRLPGIGGFVNISQSAHRVAFVGTMTTAKAGYQFSSRHVAVPAAGGVKFVDEVEQVSFSGQRALERGQDVIYVTERAVFALADDGLTLIEIAPGVDIDRDILPFMGFRPSIATTVATMDRRIFADRCADYLTESVHQS